MEDQGKVPTNVSGRPNPAQIHGDPSCPGVCPTPTPAKVEGSRASVYAVKSPWCDWLEWDGDGTFDSHPSFVDFGDGDAIGEAPWTFADDLDFFGR